MNYKCIYLFYHTLMYMSTKILIVTAVFLRIFLCKIHHYLHIYLFRHLEKSDHQLLILLSGFLLIRRWFSLTDGHRIFGFPYCHIFFFATSSEKISFKFIFSALSDNSFRKISAIFESDSDDNGSNNTILSILFSNSGLK